jgi:hypothetical protein
VKAFVPPADPVADELNVDSGITVSVSKPQSAEAKGEGDRSARGKRRAEKIMKDKSSDPIEERPKSSQSRPGSAQVLPKRKIGATTSEPKLTTPRNGNQIGVGFDCRSQRLQGTKASAKENSSNSSSSKEAEEEMKAMRDDEENMNAMTPLQRKGVQSCEDKKGVRTEEDEESIQWKEIAAPLAPTPAALGLEDENVPLSTLDTAMDWQQVQEINFLETQEREEEDEEEEEEVMYSPRSEVLTSQSSPTFLLPCRYTPITQAEYALPPFSKERGTPLRSELTSFSIL